MEAATLGHLVFQGLTEYFLVRGATKFGFYNRLEVMN